MTDRYWEWCGKMLYNYYIDAALPFDLRSAPKLFNALADALEWIAKHLGVEFLWTTLLWWDI